MSEQFKQPILETASVSDRGLSEKRPHNEDSFLLDAERRIFAVADGVGGANAGEVASQTAVEVLDEAFRHHTPGEDVEDLMEIAIQRANASIHQMSREQKQLASMATTIVALHLDGRRATVGHVGDSRLYRLDPRGQLHRETDDHSVVEEEVRAGRMTAEQAAHHPSRNVISRALGAEASVEVDMKTFDADDGTVFLLCSDGITRHLSDAEITALLRDARTLADACEEMKRRCYERGAEDNLTAITVRVGARKVRPADGDNSDDEITLVTERDAKAASTNAATGASVPVDATSATGATAADVAAASAAGAIGAATATTATTASAQSHFSRPFDTAGDNVGAKRSRIAGELRDAEPEAAHETTLHEPGPTGRAGGWLTTILLLLVVGAAAFYGGLRFQQSRNAQVASLATPTPTPTPVAANTVYESLRQQVDVAPLAESSRMASENGGKPLESGDAVFLSLYGRSLLLSGKTTDALTALRLAEQKLGTGAASPHDAVAVDTRLALAAAALSTKDDNAMREATQSLNDVIESSPANGAGLGASPSTSVSPTASPLSSPSPQ